MKVMLKNVRVSFPDLFVPKAFAGQAPKYGAAFLLGDKDTKEAKALKKKMEKAMLAVAEEKWKDKGRKILKGLLAEGRTCMRDGDTKTYEGYENNYFVSARNANAPVVLDNDKSQILNDNGRIYSGCYANAQIELWAQDNKDGGKRINATLLAVQFAGDGEAFVARPEADLDSFEEVELDEEDFADDEDEDDDII